MVYSLPESCWAFFQATPLWDLFGPFVLMLSEAIAEGIDESTLGTHVVPSLVQLMASFDTALA